MQSSIYNLKLIVWLLLFDPSTRTAGFHNPFGQFIMLEFKEERLTAIKEDLLSPVNKDDQNRRLERKNQMSGRVQLSVNYKTKHGSQFMHSYFL